MSFAGTTISNLNPGAVVNNQVTAANDAIHGNFGGSLGAFAAGGDLTGGSSYTLGLFGGRSDDTSHPEFNSLGIQINDPNHNEIPNPNYANQTNAAIAQAEWANYQQNYQPLESVLANYVNNPGYKQSQISQNVSAFNQQNQANQGTFQRNVGRFGLQLTPDQKASQQRQFNTQSATGRVEANNRTRFGLQAQEYGILGAGTQPLVSTAQGTQIQVA